MLAKNVNGFGSANARKRKLLKNAIDEDEIDKKAIKNASSGKKDSIISMANQLVKVATEMKSLAKEYKSAKEGKETEKEKEILSKLKELTAQKRKLEAKLS